MRDTALTQHLCCSASAHVYKAERLWSEQLAEYRNATTNYHFHN